MQYGKNIIAGQYHSEGEATLESVAAASGKTLDWRFYPASVAEAEAACVAAGKAYRAYRHLSPAKRAGFLEAIAGELDALDDDFIAIVCQETALPAGRIQGERKRTSNQMRLFAEVLRRGDFFSARIDTALPERKPLPRVDLRLAKMGVGAVGVFGASNFPLAFSTAGGDTASALAAGCPVVFKAHTGHMITTAYVAAAILRAAGKTGMPEGVFNLIYGDLIGATVVQHPAIKAIGFTGSLRGGRAICDMAAARPEPIPVFAEMSSINPMILLPAALEARGAQIAQELADSVVLGCGQFCTNPGLVLGVKSPAFSAFMEAFTEIMAEKPAQTMLNQATLSSYTRGVKALMNAVGFTHLAGREQQGAQAQPQLFQADIALLKAGNALLQEEVFGPTTIVIAAEDEAELLAALESMRGQLTATLIADEQDFVDYADIVPYLEEKAGRLLMNGYPTGVEVSDAMVHGGPYPATSDARGTSVGTLAIERYLRPVCYQNYPQALLPEALQDGNPLGLLRLVNGKFTRAAI